MKKGYTPVDCLRELYDNYKGEDLSAAIGVSVRQIQNYLKTEGKPATPPPGVIQKIREAFVKHEQGLPINAKQPVDYKDELLASYREQIAFLKDQLSSVTGQLRHVLLLTHAIVETSQDGLADVMVKQKIGSADEVDERLSTGNTQSYQRMKDELGIV